MAKVDDLSRSLTPLDQSSTLVCVVELSRSSWLIAGVEGQPLKKVEPDAPELMRVIERWRARQQRPIGRSGEWSLPMKPGGMGSG
jgi:transposase